jgi:hypothetical protein
MILNLSNFMTFYCLGLAKSTVVFPLKIQPPLKLIFFKNAVSSGFEFIYLRSYKKQVTEIQSEKIYLSIY